MIDLGSLWRTLCDVLFRVKLYNGVRIPCPVGLCLCSVYRTGELTRLYKVELNIDHALMGWLLDECEGPWSVGMKRPFNRRKMYVAFARNADAMLFCLKA